jgi:hypothetical protein
MNPNDLPALVTAFGPVGLVIYWIALTAKQAKTDQKSDPKADPVIEKLDKLIEVQAAMDKRMIEGNAALDRRLVKVETILEERG